MSRSPRARNGRPPLGWVRRFRVPGLQTRCGTSRLENRCHRWSPEYHLHRPAVRRLTAMTDQSSRPNPMCRPAIRRCFRANPGWCPAFHRRCPGHRRAAVASHAATAARLAGHPADCPAVRPTGRTAGPTRTGNPANSTGQTSHPTAGRNHSSMGRHWHPAAPATGCSSRTDLRSVSAATGKATRCRSGSGSGRDFHPRATKAMTRATTSPAAAASKATTSNSSSCSRPTPGHRPPATHGAG